MHPKTHKQFLQYLDSKLQSYVNLSKNDLTDATKSKQKYLKNFKRYVERVQLDKSEFWGFLENKVSNGVEKRFNNDISDQKSYLNRQSVDRLRVFYLTIFHVKDELITFKYFSFDLLRGSYSSNELAQGVYNLNEVHFGFTFNDRASILHLNFINSSLNAENYIGKKEKFKLYEAYFISVYNRNSIHVPALKSIKQSLNDCLVDIKAVFSLNKVSAVDRSHTALHSLLHELVLHFGKEDEIKVDLPTLNHLFKIVKMDIVDKVENSNSKILVERTLHSFSNVFDVYSTIRNNNSLAHPNEDLIEDDEADFMVRTSLLFLEYLDKKVF